MHNLEFATSPTTNRLGGDLGAKAFGSHVLPLPTTDFYNISLQFAPEQQLPPVEQRKLGPLFAQLATQRIFHYGVEVIARAHSKRRATLDFRSLGDLLPIFTSVVWLWEYADAVPLDAVESVCLSRQLAQRMLVAPHIAAYRMTTERYAEFLNLNWTNVLTLRGDVVDKGQAYTNAHQLVTAARCLKGDAISIGVAGYPESHPESPNAEIDMQHLKQKVLAGADYIITQICFNPQQLVDFVKRCRQHGITVPIVVGIYVPESMRTIEHIGRLTRVYLSPADKQCAAELEAKDPQLFHGFFVERACDTIRRLMTPELGVYGFHFFTMNDFRGARDVLACLASANLIEKQAKPQCGKKVE